MSKTMPAQREKHILIWEVTAVFFILAAGSALHFAFELSSFSYLVAPFAAVNESIWEHLKMAFWPSLIFFAVQYAFLKNEACAKRFWMGKALCLLLMPLIIAGGWFGFVALTGIHTFALDIALFVGAIVIGQLVSYAVLTGKIPSSPRPALAFSIILVIALAFALFTFFPPQVPLFEHGTLENSGQYGILEDYTGLLIFGE